MMLNVEFLYCYAQRRYGERHYAKCHYAGCHYAGCRNAECHNATNKVINPVSLGAVHRMICLFYGAVTITLERRKNGSSWKGMQFLFLVCCNATIDILMHLNGE
jgi:hypothetical protein